VGLLAGVALFLRAAQDFGVHVIAGAVS